jgi:basic membrane protein A
VRNWIFLPLTPWMMTFALLACTQNSSKIPPGASHDALKIGLVLDKGGRDDKSFNEAAYAGALRASQQWGLDFKFVESPNDAAFEPALRTLSERSYGLIIAVGFSQHDAVDRVAKQFPHLNYAIIDAIVDRPNVQSLLFADHEGSFLVGYAAGLATRSGQIGFIGGMDIPLIRRFQVGFEAGVAAARRDEKKPAAHVNTTFVGNTGEAWNNPARAKELAVAQYASGVDIIFAPAGASAMGVYDAAEEQNKFAIGVDSNQNGVKPGRILTSMVKRVDEAVYAAIRDQRTGNFKSGVRTFGLKDRGIDYAVDENNAKLIAPFQRRIEKARTEIIRGTLSVPDFYTQKKIRN